MPWSCTRGSSFPWSRSMRASSDGHVCANPAGVPETRWSWAARTRRSASQSRAQVARPLQNSRCLFCAGFEDTSRRVLARYLLRTRSIARSGSVSGAYKSPSIAPCKRIASGGVCAALCHPPLLCKASWRVYSYSSSPPALTPPPHSTAQHHQSQDRLTTHLGSWPGAAAKRQSPTRPRSSVV